jgi:hypothetical protein
MSGAVTKLTHAAAVTEPLLGMLAQPGNANHRHAGTYASWGIDCGAYGKAARGTPWTAGDTAAYMAYLAKVAGEVDLGGCAFAVVPDVLAFVDGAGQPATARDGGHPEGDAAATLTRFAALAPAIRRLGFRTALVAQDGLMALAGLIGWDSVDAVFLGGSDDFKLGAEGAAVTALAKAHGKWVHMGRVNSGRRFALASGYGCDSADGTYIAFGPDKLLPKVLGWLAAARAAGTCRAGRAGLALAA